jgi:hypothetical protein
MGMALMLAAGMLSGILAATAWRKLVAWRTARNEEWDPY